MSKITCIYPKEANTEFLEPVFDAICKIDGAIGIDEESDEDNYLEKIERHTKNCELVVFLGHGSSKALYGQRDNTLFDEQNLVPFQNKRNLIFACRSAEFIKRYKLEGSLGFGFIPSSLEDIKGGDLHKMRIDHLVSEDVDCLCSSISNIWLRTLDETDILNLERFNINFRFHTNLEIVRLLKRKSPKITEI